MEDIHKEDSAAVLVGRLIRSYRDDVRRRGRRLSQEGLLDLMVERGEEYAANLDRSSVSRWESGTRLAPREFLVSLGRSLRLPGPEMDRILNLAGYDTLDKEEGRAAILAAAQSVESQVESLHREVRSLMDSTNPPGHPVDAYGIAKDSLRRIAPPGVYALALGIILNALGLNGTLALLGYVLGVYAIVIGQGVLRWMKPGRDRSEHDHIVDLFFMSLFFTMDTSLLIGAFDKTDHFGFYTIEAFTNTPLSFLLTILVHLSLSLAASIMFSLLWRRQRRLRRGSAFQGAVWTTLPPLLFAYSSISILANLGAWVFFMEVFGILFGAFTIIVALSEPGMALRDERFVLRAATVVIVLLCAVGVAGSSIAYLDPDTMMTAFEFRLIPLEEVSPEQLGYTPEERVRLMRVGNLWMYVAVILYLVTVVGGYLLVTIRRAALQPGTRAHPS